MTSTRRAARATLVALLALFATACSSKDASGNKRAPAAHAALPTLAECSQRLITSGGVGPVRVGMTVDSLRLACRILGEIVDSTTAPRSPTRFVSIALGNDTGIAMVKQGRVQELLVSGAGFSTPDSIGIGTPLRNLLARPKVTGFVLDGRVHARADGICDLVFRFHTPAPLAPDRVLDGTALAQLPPSSPVDQIAAWGECEPPDTAREVTTVRVDSVLFQRDIDGNGRPDRLVRELRVSSRKYTPPAHRLALYLDGSPNGRRPAWPSEWDEFDESGAALAGIWLLGKGVAMFEVTTEGGDYTGERLVLVRGGSAHEVISHGEDYGNGFLTVTVEHGRFVIDVSQANLRVNGKPVLPEARCSASQWSAVHLIFDVQRNDFVPDRARCVDNK